MPGSCPPRHLWQEVLLVLLGLLEAAGVLLLDPWPPTPGLIARTAVGLACVLALLLRFRAPRALLPVILAVNSLAGSVLVLVVATYAYASRTPLRGRTVAVGALAVTSVLGPIMLPAGVLGTSAPPTGGLLVSVVVASVLSVAIAASLGMYAGTRRLLLEGLRARADEAEAHRAEAEEQARRAERTRIAREMHDIVAHKISLVALQAGALEVNPDLERERIAQSAALIRSTATEALAELRQVLGVLRGSDESAPLAPQPTWEDVRRLVDGSREAGIRVDLFDFIDDPVPDPLARTAYRVVQEGLTNIHKHARSSSARVALIGEPGEDLVIEVSNVLPQGFTTDLPGARMGLSGIEARVAHAGGRITSGPTDDGRFLVKVVLPWPQAAP